MMSELKSNKNNLIPINNIYKNSDIENAKRREERGWFTYILHGWLYYMDGAHRGGGDGGEYIVYGNR
jgi:hypothetical protein